MKSIFRILICTLLLIQAGANVLYAQCGPNNIEFVGGERIYNSACGNVSYQNIDGSTPTGTGNSFIWEVSFSGGAYTVIRNNSGVAITSEDLSKSEITSFILGPAGNAAGDYRIRRFVTNSSLGCSNPSAPVFLYYSQSASTISGGFITGNSVSCSPASGDLLLQGHTGPILKWEMQDINGNWILVDNKTNTLSYSNLTASTCYRALVDNICGANSTLGVIDAGDKYSTTFCITVNSAPAITAQPASQSVCIGSSVTLSVTATSSTAMSYQWRKDGFEINNAVSSSYTIGSASNSDAGSYDVVITNSCGTVTSSAAVVVVNPTPVAIVPSNVVACPGSLIPSAVFTSSPAGATFTWANSNTAIGIAASGSGDLPAFTATNTTTSPISATITVTPLLNGCAGSPSSYTITVNPTATVTVPSNIVVCSGNTVSATNFVGSPSGTTFTWTNSNTAIGLAASGTGNIPSFTAASSGSATITVTPSVNGCAGTPSTYTITVNPLPIIVSATKTNESICDANDGSITIDATGSAPLEYSIDGGATFFSNGGIFVDLGSGSYAVAVRNGAGCIVAGNILSITSPGAPDPPAIDPYANPICEGTSLILKVTNPDANATYNWTGPMGFTGTGTSIDRGSSDPSMSGNYAVTATIGSCVSSSTIFSVTVNRKPVVAKPADLTFCAGNSIPAADFISTPAGATYSWTNSNINIGLAADGTGPIPTFIATNTTTSPITATIWITPTLNNCVGEMVSYTITINPTPVIDAKSDLVFCHGSTIPVQTFSSNVSGTTFAWTVTALGATFSGTGSIPEFTAINNGTTPITGTVTVTALNNGCSSQPMSYEIKVNPLPRITNAPLNQTTCSGISTTEVVLTSDVFGADFSWTAVASSGDITGFTPNGAGNIPAQVITNSGTVEGRVTFTVTATANGCSGPPTSYVIRVDPIPKLLSTINLSQTICSGSSSTAVNLSSEVTGTTFNWTTTVSGQITGFQSTGSGQTQLPSQTLFNLGTSQGSVTYTIVPFADGCPGPPSVYTIYVNPLPTATISGNATVCFGADATLNVALTGTAPWTISYSDGTGIFTISGITTNSYNFQVSATTTKTYTIQSVSDAFCANSGTGTATITQPTAPISATSSATNVTCFGAANGSITFTAILGGSGAYGYSIDGGATWQTNPTFAGLAPGSYNLQIRDAANTNCVFIFNDAVSITQPLAPLAAAFANPVNILCFGESTGSASVLVSGGTAPYTYLWSNGVTTAEITNVPAGTYSVNVSDANGCSLGSAMSVTITQPAFALNASAISTNVTCSGGNDGSITITNSIGGSGSYEYSINGGASWQTGTVFSNLAAAAYNIRIRDASAQSCIYIVDTSFNIAQPAPLNAVAAATDITCFGSSDGTITFSNMSGGSGSYQYSIDNGINWQNSMNFTGLKAGMYCLQVRDAVNPSCVFIVSSCLVLKQPVVISGIVEIKNVTCKGSADGILTVTNTAGGYGTYEYSKDGGLTWQVSPIFVNVAPGVYRVQVRDKGNPTCVQTLNPNAVVREAAEPLVASISSLENVNCFGSATGSVSLFVRGGMAPYTYVWTNGKTTKDLKDVPAGVYTVTITDSYNCVSTQAVTISQPAAPLEISFTKNEVSCFGSDNGVIRLTVTGGNAPYSYRWSNGRTSKDLTNLAVGTYTISITDAKGCTLSQAIDISQPALALAANVVKSNVTCFGASDGSITLTMRGGTAPYSYAWAGGQKTSSITGLAPGSYSVTIADAAGCVVRQTVSIIQSSTPLKMSLAIKNTICRTSSDGEITASITGGTAPYTILYDGRSQASNVITGLSAGNYQITVRDAMGCSFIANGLVGAGICPPMAVDDSFKIYEGETASGTTALNDYDRENEKLTFSLSGQPKNGTITFNDDGSFKYSPNAGFLGTETMPYKICNTSGVCSSASLIIRVATFSTVNLTPGLSNVREGKKVSVTAFLEKPFTEDVIIKLGYSGKAIKDRDYVLLDQFIQIMIPKGQLTTTQKITIAALTDDMEEGDENLTITILSTSDPDVKIGTPANVTIVDVYPPEPIEIEKKEAPINPDIAIDPLLSPNGDGQGNDVFNIVNIVSFPDNEVLIFNRWGNEVFRMKGYNESDRVFKGYANTGMLTNTNTPLADGVYYYLITTRKTVSGTKVEALNKGFIILKR
ncbi:MAG: PKD-like domain-containing protein [Daejeonella sp.]|uniref:PKD-like domain-containing protein n=1 Tax=Daejeonella sp. TaxID=2805397 RepID=UPI003C732AC2